MADSKETNEWNLETKRQNCNNELTGITPGNKTAWKKLTAFLGGCCCCWLADDDYENEASNKESVNVVYLVEMIH